MEKKNFNWAILGPGGIAHKFVKGIPHAPGAALYAVGSRDGSRAKAFAGQYGAQVYYGSYEELAGDRDVDAVYIATPHTAHCENAVLCLEHGKPALCEKPMAVNSRQIRRMADAAKANGAFLMEAMWTRFHPAMARVRQLLAEGAIGEPMALTADFSFSIAFDPASRLFDPALGGGALLDVGIYVMSFASMVFGPKPVKAEAYCRRGKTGVDEVTAILLEYSGGRMASLTCGVRSAGSHEARVMGTDGRIELQPFWKAEAVRVIKGDAVEDIRLPFGGNGYEYQIMEVMDCVAKGLKESPVMPVSESIAILETMDGFREKWGLKYLGE